MAGGGGGLLLAGVVLATVLSPYRRHDGGAYPQIREAVDVSAPCATVFDYLADSGHARDWSVYVDHITPLNVDSVPDGAQGSIRRSFRNADETGMRWDEYFVLVDPPRRRRLRIYNVQDVALRTDADLLTEQLYEPLPGGRCRLAFTVFLDGEPSLSDRAKVVIASYRLSSIFESNISNVKRIIEAEAGSRASAADGAPAGAVD